MEEESVISAKARMEVVCEDSDSDSDALTINEDILVPIVEIKEDTETDWKLKRMRNRARKNG